MMLASQRDLSEVEKKHTEELDIFEYSIMYLLFTAWEQVALVVFCKFYATQGFQVSEILLLDIETGGGVGRDDSE